MTARTQERITFLSDVLVSAVEGGIGYWADTKEYQWKDESEASVSVYERPSNNPDFKVGDRVEFAPDNLQATVISIDPIRIRPDDEGEDEFNVAASWLIPSDKWHTIGLNEVARGIGLVIDKDFNLNREMKSWIRDGNAENDAGTIDAGCADAIVQAAIFGHVVYG